MSRPAFLVLGLIAVLVSGAGRAAANDPRVPRVSNADLPVMGTCGEIERTNVTHVMLGKVGWYLVAGVSEPLDADGLQALLAKRAGTTRPSPHSVWLQASKRHAWAHVVKARIACAEAGIYRVGVRVLSETDRSKIYGYPLFLPAAKPPTGPAAGIASRLPVSVDVPDLGGVLKEAPPASDPAVLWKAAVAAREMFDQDVVAEVRIHNNVSLQYALTVLDYLHRAGCIAVRLLTLQMVPGSFVSESAQISIVRMPRHPDYVLPSEVLEPIAVPSVDPREGTWPLHGANRPGAMYLELVDLPKDPGDRPERVRGSTEAYPNYLRRGRVPAGRGTEVTQRIVDWARGLGPALLAGKTSSAKMKDRMVVRLRTAEKLAPLLGPVSRAFPDADRMNVTSLSLDVLLFDDGQPVGLLDVTLYVHGGVSVLAARRASDDSLPIARNLPPEPVDPFAAGVPGAIRVWLEGLLLSRKAAQPATLPFTPMRQVLDALPASDHARAQQFENRRRADAERMATFVRGLAFDRIVLRVREASASVSSHGKVIGTLRFGLEAEEKELRIDAFEPQRGR